MNKSLALLGAIVGCVVCPPAPAQPKEFPVRPVRLAVPVPPGGSLDVMARILSPKWGEVMDQNVIIDYRPGANTIVGSEHVARAPADGYTLLINTLPFVVNPALYPKMPFNTERDFAPVSLLGFVPVRAGRSPLGAGKVGQGADRARPSAPGQAELFVSGRR